MLQSKLPFDNEWKKNVFKTFWRYHEINLLFFVLKEFYFCFYIFILYVYIFPNLQRTFSFVIFTSLPSWKLMFLFYFKLLKNISCSCNGMWEFAGQILFAYKYRTLDWQKNEQINSCNDSNLLLVIKWQLLKIFVRQTMSVSKILLYKISFACKHHSPIR